jgi:ABC-type bacteriocin/lantibiotic exporter with double-glycine peptidase domain
LQSRTATSVGVIGFLAIAFTASWMVTDQNTTKSPETEADNKADVVYLGSAGVAFQNRSNDCGVAALVMVLDRYGKKDTQRELGQKAKLKFQGASLLTLKELAKSAGLEAEGRKLGFDDLTRIQLPVILFVEGHHFIVVDSVDGRGFLFVRDPAVGKLKIPRRRAVDIWKGEALVITGIHR